MIAGIASKVFSDCNDHMETKFSFCQRSPTIPATANDRNDHNCWDKIIFRKTALIHHTKEIINIETNLHIGYIRKVAKKRGTQISS